MHRSATETAAEMCRLQVGLELASGAASVRDAP